MSLLFIPLAGLCDAARGGRFHNKLPSWYPLSLKIPANIVIASMYCTLIGWSWFSLILIAWFPLANQIFGTGNIFGKMLMGHSGYINGDDWERGMVTDNAWWSACLMGFYLTLPCIPVAVYLEDITWSIPSLAYMIATPLSGLVARKWFYQHWTYLEASRGTIAMYLSMLFLTLI